jgi:hypothetical protein
MIPLVGLSMMQVHPARRTGEVVELTFRLQRPRHAEYVSRSRCGDRSRSMMMMAVDIGTLFEMARISQWSHP